MLRRKSNSDLEKLWYSLLREKLAIQSDKYSLTQKNLRIRDEVKTSHSKVCVSMSRIKTVFAEREKINNEFTMLLEYWYIRNKQMSNDKFEVTKKMSQWAKKKVYDKMPLEDPKNKNKLLQEIKLLEREKDLQLKNTKEAVIQEKKKEINLLKEEIQERVLANFIQEKERLKKLREKESPKISEEITAAKRNLKDFVKKRAETKDENIKREATKSIKNLAAKLEKLKTKLLVETAEAQKAKLSASKNHKEIDQDTAVSSENNNSNESEKGTTSNIKVNNQLNAEDSRQKQIAGNASSNINSRDIDNFKKNTNSKNQSTDIQKQKSKKAKNASATAEGSSADNAQESAAQSEESANTAEAQQSDIKGQSESQKKMSIESYKQLLVRKERKELENKIKTTLRGKVIRLGVKYRAVLADHKKITLDKIAPYRRRLYNEMRNLDDITKVGYEYNVVKPNFLEPIKVNTTEQKYQDILLGKIKAPVPYKRKTDDANNKKYVQVLNRKEISHAKSLIQRKNRKQVLSLYLKNADMIGKAGRTNAYNKIQKIRAKHAQDIFLKELSALKHHLKQPNSFYKKFENAETNKNE